MQVKRRNRATCCCRPAPAPVCGTCNAASYFCCTQPVFIDRFWNTQGEEESGVFNCLKVTIIPTADERRRVIPIQSSIASYVTMTDTPWSVSCLIPFGGSIGGNPSASNGAQDGTGAGYDACVGTALNPTPFGNLPDDYIPIGGIFGSRFMTFGSGPLSLWTSGDTICCGGQRCPGITDTFSQCLADLCYCDSAPFDECDGASDALFSTYSNYINIPAQVQATGAAINLEVSGCNWTITGFVEFTQPLLGSSDFRYVYDMAAYGKFAVPTPPDCDQPTDDDKFGKCPQELIWVGGRSPLANAPILEPTNGPCGGCFPDPLYESTGGYDCRCDIGGALLFPENEGPCPPKRNSICKGDGPNGIWDCNECGEAISGGHFSAKIGD